MSRILLIFVYLLIVVPAEAVGCAKKISVSDIGLSVFDDESNSNYLRINFTKKNSYGDLIFIYLSYTDVNKNRIKVPAYFPQGKPENVYYYTLEIDDELREFLKVEVYYLSEKDASGMFFEVTGFENFNMLDVIASKHKESGE